MKKVSLILTGIVVAYGLTYLAIAPFSGFNTRAWSEWACFMFAATFLFMALAIGALINEYVK